MSARAWALATIVGAVLFSGIVDAKEPYVTLPRPAERSPGSVEVVEFFWYGCEHCYLLEAKIAAWRASAPKGVVFRRIPAASSANWIPMARMFYTIEALGDIDRVHPQIFEAIHRKRLRLEQPEVRTRWLSAVGLDPVKYEQVERSGAITAKVNEARRRAMDYRVEAVPTFVINGRYLTSAHHADGADKLFGVIDGLIAKAQGEK